MSNKIIEARGIQGDSRSLSLDVNTEQLKHIFYMLHGETMTRSRPFKGAIQVSKECIIVLVRSIAEQLKLAQVRDVTTTVGVGFENDFVEKPFKEFCDYAWTESDATKEVTIKINFLLLDYDTNNQLKHSVYIRIAKGIKPGNLLQLMASNDSEKLDDLENMMSPVFCRTDYVNDKLSKDIMRVVEDWHRGQKQPKLLSGGYEFLKKHKLFFARLVHYSFPVSSLVFLCYLTFFLAGHVQQEVVLPALVSVVIASMVVFSVMLNIGGERANKVYSKLSDISGEEVIFDLTRGDEKAQSDIINKNVELFKSSRSIFIWTNAQAIGASLLAAGVCELIKRLAA